MKSSPRASYYPVCLALTGQPCLVVGGGRVAQRKVAALRTYGGDVTVVSPTVTPMLRRWAQRGAIRWRRRTFRAADAAGRRLIYAATDDPRVQEAVRRAAQQRHALVNVVDRPALCTFIAPAQLKRGDLTIAMHRIPVGEWMCLDAATTGESHGIGLARARLWDTAGLVGRSLQTLLLEPRAEG